MPPNSAIYVIVQFTNRILCDNVYAASLVLVAYNCDAVSKIFINEGLSQTSGKLFGEFRKVVMAKQLL